MKRIYLQMFLALFLCTGCVSTWTKSSGQPLDRSSTFGVEINKPVEWYGIKFKNSNCFTRHGLPIDNITITRVKWNDTLDNGHTIPKNILLHEIPELILADFYTLTNAYNLNVVNNQIVSLDSLPCTRTLFEYTNSNSLDMRGILYCIPLAAGITTIFFTAEKSIYFERYENDLSTMVQSTDIIDKKYFFLPGISPTVD